MSHKKELLCLITSKNTSGEIAKSHSRIYQVIAMLTSMRLYMDFVLPWSSF